MAVLSTDVDYLARLHETSEYTNAGTVDQSLPQPKGSLTYTVNDSLEFYASAGRGFHSADVRGVLQDRNSTLGLPPTALLSKQEGQEVGLRAAISRQVTTTVAFYNLWQSSETIINPDVGSDTPGPPSRRYGIEINTTYKINQWLEFYGSIAGNHTRFTHPLDDGTGHQGYYITAAPLVTGSLALYPRTWDPGAEASITAISETTPCPPDLATMRPPFATFRESPPRAPMPPRL